MNPPSPPQFRRSFSWTRRPVVATSVIVSILAVLSLVVMFNYLAQHYAPRLYWGASRDYRLSTLTTSALQTLTNDVRVVVFFRREHPIYPSVRALLHEYAAASARLHVEELDYSRNPAAAQEFRRRFPLTIRDDEPDLVLFESGSHTRAVAARDLRDYDTRALLRGATEAAPTAFKGEPLFTSAINAVCEGRTRRVRFLEGHREHDLRSDTAQTGYLKLASLLQEDNIEVAPLTLRGRDEVPADCELLVVAGPQERLAASELQAIDRFLRRGGRLLVLFRSRAVSGLEVLLADWGIRVGDSLVLDPDNSDNGVLLITGFGNHPVTRPLARSRLYQFLPRAVEPQPVANILGAPARVETLLRTGSNGVAVTSFVPGGYRFTPEDRRGEIPLAVAVERGALPGVAASLGTTRIVAVGDSTFLAGQLIEFAGNRHFAISAVNWLLDRSHLLGGIAPTPIRTYQVILTPHQQTRLRWLLLAVCPGSILALGLIVWWGRH